MELSASVQIRFLDQVVVYERVSDQIHHPRTIQSHAAVTEEVSDSHV